MKIFRTKNFSFFDSIKNLFSSNKSKPVEENKTIQPVQRRNLKMIPITFEEGYNADYWPALVVLGIKNDNTPDGGWSEFVTGFMASHNFFDKGGELENIYVLSKLDNVNGNNGANVIVLKFSKDTEINSGTRLCYGSNFKWPEDVFCFYNNYYTWYKSGKRLYEEQQKKWK